jgi:hypothetical protein
MRPVCTEIGVSPPRIFGIIGLARNSPQNPDTRELNWPNFDFVVCRDRYDLRLPHLSRFSNRGPLRTQIPRSSSQRGPSCAWWKSIMPRRPPSPLRCRIPAVHHDQLLSKVCVTWRQAKSQFGFLKYWSESESAVTAALVRCKPRRMTYKHVRAASRPTLAKNARMGHPQWEWRYTDITEDGPSANAQQFSAVASPRCLVLSGRELLPYRP